MQSFVVNYIYNCDLIYRFKSKNINTLPKIKDVCIKVSLVKFFDFIKMYALSNLSEKDVQISLFFFFYATFFSIPYLSLKKAAFRSELKFEKSYLRLNFLSKKSDHILFNFFSDFYSYYQLFILNSSSNIKKNALPSLSTKNHFVKLELSNLSEINFYSRELLMLSDLSEVDFLMYIKSKNIMSC